MAERRVRVRVKGVDGLDARLQGGLVGAAAHDRRLLLIDHDLLRAPEILQCHVGERDVRRVADDPPADLRRQIGERVAAGRAVERRHDRADLQRPLQLVDDQQRERLALQFGDHQQRAPGLRHLLEQRDQRLHLADLVGGQQDVRVVELRDQAFPIGHEVPGGIPAVDLRALRDLELGRERGPRFDVDDPLEADLADRLRDQLADRRVAVRADGRHLGDVARPAHALRHLRQRRDHAFDADLDAALEPQRVVARRDQLRPLAIDGVRDHRRGGRPVARGVAGLDRALQHHLRAHVRERFGELDLLGDRHPVLGDERRAVHRPLEEDVSPARTERHLHGAGEHARSLEQAGAPLVAEQ